MCFGVYFVLLDNGFLKLCLAKIWESISKWKERDIVKLLEPRFVSRLCKNFNVDMVVDVCLFSFFLLGFVIGGMQHQLFWRCPPPWNYAQFKKIKDIKGSNSICWWIETWVRQMIGWNDIFSKRQWQFHYWFFIYNLD